MKVQAFRAQGVWFRVWGLGFRVQGLWSKVQGLGLVAEGSGCLIEGAGAEGFRVSDPTWGVPGILELGDTHCGLSNNFEIPHRSKTFESKPEPASRIVPETQELCVF